MGLKSLIMGDHALLRTLSAVPDYENVGVRRLCFYSVLAQCLKMLPNVKKQKPSGVDDEGRKTLIRGAHQATLTHTTRCYGYPQWEVTVDRVGVTFPHKV